VASSACEAYRPRISSPYVGKTLRTAVTICAERPPARCLRCRVKSMRWAPAACQPRARQRGFAVAGRRDDKGQCCRRLSRTSSLSRRKMSLGSRGGRSLVRGTNGMGAKVIFGFSLALPSHVLPSHRLRLRLRLCCGATGEIQCEQRGQQALTTTATAMTARFQPAQRGCEERGEQRRLQSRYERAGHRRRHGDATGIPGKMRLTAMPRATPGT